MQLNKETKPTKALKSNIQEDFSIIFVNIEL